MVVSNDHSLSYLTLITPRVLVEDGVGPSHVVDLT